MKNKFFIKIYLMILNKQIYTYNQKKFILNMNIKKLNLKKILKGYIKKQ